MVLLRSQNISLVNRAPLYGKVKHQIVKALVVIHLALVDDVTPWSRYYGRLVK